MGHLFVVKPGAAAKGAAALGIIAALAVGASAAADPLSAQPATSPAAQPVFDLPALTVTASRVAGGAEGAPLPTTLFAGAEVGSATVLAIDDLLRQLPGFSLFRRTSSVLANPTTQGASLRGIGPSGASRALVLLDGVPFNDAFGGWVYWSQLDLQGMQRVEVVRGGGSTAWGNTALGGVIQFVPREPAPATLEFNTVRGSRDTTLAGLYASERLRDWGIALEAGFFETDGHARVRADQRGAVDIPSTARHQRLGLTVQHDLPAGARLTVRASAFAEERGNGTPLTANATDQYRAHAKLEWTGAGRADWRADLYASTSEFSSTFSSVAADRQSETLVLDQYAVPADTVGMSVVRTAAPGGAIRLATGADLRWIEGATHEYVVFQRDDRIAGGEQDLLGVFIDLTGEPSSATTWQFGLRGDLWRNRNGFIEQPNRERERFANEERFILNTRLGIARRIGGALQLRAAAYQAYRVPTINELYRPFQVGADLTLANPALAPERLLGAEAGVDWAPAAGLALRATAFFNRVSDPVLNVTTGTTGQGGRLRQRQNIGRTEVAGLELDGEYRLSAATRLFAAVALTDARVRKAASQPALVGRRLAQVPRFAATFGLRHAPGATGPAVSLQGRWTGMQHEDDLNERRLGGYLQLDAVASYRLGPQREIFIRVENLLDRRHADGITGTSLVTEGAPRTALAGLRWRF